MDTVFGDHGNIDRWNVAVPKPRPSKCPETILAVPIVPELHYRYRSTVLSDSRRLSVGVALISRVQIDQFLALSTLGYVRQVLLAYRMVCLVGAGSLEPDMLSPTITFVFKLDEVGKERFNVDVAKKVITHAD
jgi:hypothetical protein